MDSFSRAELFDFHGVSMTHYFTDNWENIQSFQAQPDDILIATYPKAGTTWVSNILDQLYFGLTSPERQTSIPIYTRVPNLEITIPALQPEMDSFSRAELFDFHGVSMTHYFTDNWENIQSLQAQPDDILIATYPKAGTTWVSNILDQLYFSQTSPERHTSSRLYRRVPHLEIALPALRTEGSGIFSVSHKGTDLVNQLSSSPRIIRSHLPVQFVPKSFWEQNCKIVYVARNAKDSMVSYFHLDRMLMLHPEPGDWSSYFHRFMEGKMVFGSWYDHVNSWWKKKQTYSKLHYMFYEDLIEDTGREIDKLCSFLGLSRSVEEKERIRGRVQFDFMKKDNMVNYSAFPGMDLKVSPFMRKGKVGDWKNHFTVAQSEQFDEDYKEKMKDSTLQFRTEI